ncbi:serine/threonine protein kinase containing WD-40 repeat domain [Nitzschia inconspicua]|uniref:Serine/threonine protein kinase containing WD-40 repeat domain n=1 Tax=Nitzschia inconspicua TaxID=303405 RepID=A0A9K3PZH8_9STRA|nr:serine/threonine protein kinase containing WD-40 repeat domain [Nitzschia inconspicua]
MSDSPTPQPRNDSGNNHDGSDGVDASNANTDALLSGIPQELPFLVTHWLANFDNQRVVANDASIAPSESERQHAIARIRRATSEIASAFATLGAYGTSMRPSFDSFSQSLRVRNSTFADINRQYSGLSPSHLEHLARSVVLHNNSAMTTAMDEAPANLMLQATSCTESLLRNKDSNNTSNTSNEGEGTTTSNLGRTLQDAIDLEDNENVTNSDRNSSSSSSSSTLQLEGSSILQNPALMLKGNCESTSNKDAMLIAERKSDPLPTMKIKATYWEVGQETAETMRKLLALREKNQSTETAIQSLKRSLSTKEMVLVKINEQLSSLEHDDNLSIEDKAHKNDELVAEQQQCDRVISHIHRTLIDLNKTLSTEQSELVALGAKAQSMEEQRRSMIQNYNDPFAFWKGPLPKGSSVGGCKSLRLVMGRQYGLSRSQLWSQRPMWSSISKGVNPSHFLEARKNVLKTQLSHAITINTHLNTPVYCVHFDKTGRYFITGADDYLVKVFCLGAAQSCRTQNERSGSRRLRCNYGANFRGAVLVCSLRGHAGVINDIDVSSDNCFLATASTDQDVRIWGLKDGCPIAILRGHKNGANMVSWSTLTPYRLVTTASDGFARVWDIREACLKRYGKFVGNRDEYTLSVTVADRKNQPEGTEGQVATFHGIADAHHPLASPSRTSGIVGAPLASGPPALPPLPSPGNAENDLAQPHLDSDQNENNAGVDIPAPPLPGAPPQIAANANQNEGVQAQGEQEVEPGDFIMNDLIDEGVKLVSKYCHGSLQDSQQEGLVTRSRRAAVNVICVARCPSGNHFATGSDDGIVRVWQDFDDSDVALVDNRHVSGSSSSHIAARPPASGVEYKPRLKLTGHVSTITDLEYSHAGDRIVSASQKDGVARIWNVASALSSVGSDKTVTQIVIKLKDPSSNKPAQAPRRRPGNLINSSSSKVSCEVAVWTHDDLYIVTSQCVLLKQGGNEIQPGSQFIFLWLSRTGQCLMGVSGAHTMPCNVVLPHPLDSSIICTASDDGCAKLWDLTEGKCIFTHQNKVEFGPIEPNDDGVGEYLDGSFSPDGTAVVLSDSRGQISVFDCTVKQDNPSNDGNALSWMREQYFSNDYYELFYDTNGYCIEKGSQQPPHLAPKSRCTHNGSSFPGADDVTETFKRLMGPLPLPEDVCRWCREEIRGKINAGFSSISSLSSSGIRITVREYDPKSTLLLKGIGHQDANEENTGKKTRHTASSSSTRGNADRNLSQRFNYLGYDDLLMREGLDDDGPESDDEEFEPTNAASRGRRLNATGDESEDDDNIDDLSLESYEENHRRRRSRGNVAASTTEERRARANRRARRKTNMSDFMEIDSDDEATEQYMSVNKTANGPYLRDFTREGHLWKLKNLADVRKVHREWLRRDESDLSYFGKKFYAPQVGDSVVYIPRAHYETIKEYPSLSPPWQDWPTGTAWPTVRCSVQNIRYRFPYEDYFRQGNFMCRSIVAIVTLQVTGVPAPSTDRVFPWPKPEFVEPSQSAVFEVSVFENEHEDYLIPEFLYTSRLKSLEKNVRDRGMAFEGLPVDLFYSNDSLTREDSELQPWASSVTGIQLEDPHSDIHLSDSGFCVLGFVGVDEDNYEDTASPWEINTEGLSLRRPSLTEEEEKEILDALKELLQKPDISTYFSMPVDQERYYDYGVMIEVPMDLMFVKRRLRNRYYGSKLSVVADLRLIRDNCIKYNTSENEISKAAVDMCNEFEEKILTPEERSQLVSEEEFEKIREDQSNGRQSSNLRIRLSARTIRMAQQAAASTSASSGGTYSLRDRSSTPRRSSLERLPAPEEISGRNRSADLRRGPRGEASNNASVTRGGRYSLRGQGAGNRTETLARLRAGESREERATRRSRASTDQRLENGRSSTRYNGNLGGDEVNDEEDDVMPTLRGTRRSSRSQRTEPPRYQDHNSDVDDGEVVEPTRASRTGRARIRSATSSANRTTNRRTLRESSEDGDDDEAEASKNEEDSDGIVEDSDEVLSEALEEIPQASRRRTRAKNETPSRRSSRPSRTAAADGIGEDCDEVLSDAIDESDEETPPTRSRRTRRKGESPSQRSPRPSRTSTAASSEDSPGRRSRRIAVKRPSYRDVEDSDAEEYVEESSDIEEEEEEEETPPPSTSRKRTRVSYAEESSDEDEESDFENAQRNSNKRKSRSANSKRRMPAKKAKTPGTNSTGAKPTRKSKNSEIVELPDLKPWPEIEISEITRVTNELLGRVVEQDDQGVFAVPVVEAYPEMSDAYLSVVDEPMDLRTIEEERMHAYTSISQLQDDLILMYNNCCKFNGPASVLGKYATERWAALNDLFNDVCKSLNVLVPRRWNS